MKKIYSKLSVILIMLLSLVFAISTASLLITNVFADTAKPAQETVQSEQESWYEIKVDNDDKSLTILVDGTIGSYADLSAKDFADIKNKLFDAVKTLIIDRLLDASVESGNKGENVVGTIANELDFDNDTLKKYEDYIRERLSQEGELDRYLRGEYDVLIKYAVNQYLNSEEPGEDFSELVEKATGRVQKIVDDVIQQQYENRIEQAATEAEKAQLRAEQQAATERNNGKFAELVTEVTESGSAVITPAELVNAIDYLTVGDSVLYSNGKFSLAAVKELLLSLPRPAEIAELSYESMFHTFHFGLKTNLSDAAVDFNVTLGLKSGYANVRNMAKFIADHIDVANVNGVYSVNIKVPEEFSSVLLSAANSDILSDDIKHLLFGMLNRPANEIVDEVTGYTYGEVIDYFKGVKFHKIFSNILNADYLRGFFKDYGVSIESLTNDNIDRLLNAILNYCEKLANKQTVEGLEEFLQSYGIPGIPSELESIVQKFLNVLNKIDYEYYDAAELRAFLTSEERISNFIGKLEANYSVESLYYSFVDYAETFFNKLPERLHDGKVINLYNDSALAWAGNVHIDVKDILTKIVETLNKDGKYEDLQATVDSALAKIDGKLSYDVNLDLNISIPDIYKVTYMVEDEVIGTGLLPAGADVNFYANKADVDGYAIRAWSDAEGNIYSVDEGVELFAMPKNDITLHAITDFGAELTVKDGGEVVAPVDGIYTKEYDGKSVTLTAEVSGGVGYEPAELTYQWYSVSQQGALTAIEGADSQTYEITDYVQGGEYVCKISEVLYAANGDVVLEADTANTYIIINKATLDLSAAKWMVTNTATGTTSEYDPANSNYEYTGSVYNIELTGYPQEVTVDYVGTRSESEVGEYSVYAQCTSSDNYMVSGLLSGTETNPITWSIYKKTTPPEPDHNAPVAGHVFTYSNGGITINITDVQGVVRLDTLIKATNNTTKYSLADFESCLQLEEGKEASVINVYDIGFDGVDVTGEFIVEFECSDFAGKTIVLIHMHGVSMEKIESTLNGNKLSFTVNGFSDFAAISVEDSQAEQPPVENEENSNWWIWFLIAIIVILVVIIVVLLIYLLRKDNKPEGDPRPDVIIIRTDEVAEETDEEAEDSPLEEETAAAEDDEDSGETDDAMPLVAEDGSRIVYDKSFRARLSQADSVIKDYYTELKNDILSYKGVKSRVSWHYDSFNKGRTKCIKLQLRGKSMYMYIALSASELPGKYNVKDMSDKSRYSDVPTMLKVRKPRSLKYAKQLVAILMEKLGAERGETPDDKYRPRYRSTQSLIDMGLIKVKYTKSTFAAPKKQEGSEN